MRAKFSDSMEDEERIERDVGVWANELQSGGQLHYIHHLVTQDGSVE